MCVVWAPGLVPPYFACLRCRAFQQSRPVDSVGQFC
jgi:hypothetical protein